MHSNVQDITLHLPSLFLKSTRYTIFNMSQFVGKWKSNPKSRKNSEEFVKKAGIPDALVKKYRDSNTYVEYQNKGDNWTLIVSTDVAPEPKTYTFKLGEEVLSKDMEGKDVRFTCMLNKDGSWTDIRSAEMMKWKETKTTRVVKGNTMFVTVEQDGVTMSYEMDRQ